MTIRNLFRTFLALIAITLASACSTGQAPAPVQPAQTTPLPLKLCPLPNIPSKKISSVAGYREYVVTVTDRSGKPITYFQPLTSLTRDTGGRLWVVTPLQTNSGQKLANALTNFTNSIGHGYSIGIAGPPNIWPKFKVPGRPDAIGYAKWAGI